MTPLVSIIIPVYGVEHYIEKCIRSVLEQTYSNLEVVVVDDATKDSSIIIIERIILEYSYCKTKNIKIIQHSSNRGLSAARQTGIDASTGKYIIHVDSDDYIEPVMVEKLVNAAESDDADMAICGAFYDYRTTTHTFLPAVCQNKLVYLKNLITQKVSTNIWGRLIKRSLYVENNIRCLEGINYGEDYAIIPKLVYYSNKIISVNAPLYHYVRYNADSYTSSFNLRNIENAFAVYDSLFSFFEKKGFVAEELDIARLQIKAWAIGKLLFFSDDSKVKVKYIMEAEYIPKLNQHLSLYHHVILWLCNKKWITLLNVYIFIINHLYNILKKYLHRL